VNRGTIDEGALGHRFIGNNLPMCQALDIRPTQVTLIGPP